MKNISEIKNEKLKLFDTKKSEVKKSELDKIVKRIEFLKLCELYLEGSPTIEFILSEYDRITTRINVLLERFEKWVEERKRVNSLFIEREEKKKYENDNGIPLLRLQLKTLEFLKS